MSTDLFPEVTALNAALVAAAEAREQTKHRIVSDPIAYALSHIVRRAVATGVEATADKSAMILDATAAILTLIDPAEVRGRAKAIADLRDERAYALWWNEQLDLPPSTWTGPWTREQFAAYLEAKGHHEPLVDRWATVEVIHPAGGVEPIVGEMAEFEVGPFDAAIGALRAEADRLDVICPPEIDLGFRGHREAANWLEYADDEAKGHQPWLPPHA